MKHYRFRNLCRALVISSLLLSSAQAISAPEGKQLVADVFFDNTSISFSLKGNFQNASVGVTGPRNFNASSSKGKGDPSIDLRKFGELDDGLYRYQIAVATDKTIKLRKNRLDNGRGKKERSAVSVAETQSGYFRMKNGSIVIPSKESEEK